MILNSYHMLIFRIIGFCHGNPLVHDDVIQWKHFSRYWLFLRRIHRSPVNSLHKCQWRGAMMLSLICAWGKVWVNSREDGDLIRHRAHYDVTVMHSWIPPTWAQRDRNKSVICKIQITERDKHPPCLVWRTWTGQTRNSLVMISQEMKRTLCLISIYSACRIPLTNTDLLYTCIPVIILLTVAKKAFCCNNDTITEYEMIDSRKLINGIYGSVCMYNELSVRGW